MKNILNTYLKIIELKNSQLIDGYDSCPNSYNYNPIILSNLLFETVFQRDLDPIPAKFFYFICSKLNIKQPSKFEISYVEIFNLLEKFGYDSAAEFMKQLNCLKSFNSGKLTIGICHYDLTEFKDIFKSSFMTEQRIETFFSNISEATAGNTFSADPLLRGNYQNVCIYLNIDMIKQYSTWKDTLNHELSHFVQRIVNMANNNSIANLDKIILKNPINGTIDISNAFQLTEENIEKLSNILKPLNFFPDEHNQYLRYFVQMLSQTLKLSEVKTTTQNILNGFQRMYEQQVIKNGKPIYQKVETGHDILKNKQQRLTWLTKQLYKINSKSFFETDFGFLIAKEFFASSYKKLFGTFEEQKLFKDAVIIFQYLGIKNCLPELKIDERLYKHFAEFRFRQ